MVVLVKVGHLVFNIYDGECYSLEGHVMKISRVTVLLCMRHPMNVKEKP